MKSQIYVVAKKGFELLNWTCTNIETYFSIFYIFQRSVEIIWTKLATLLIVIWYLPTYKNSYFTFFALSLVCSSFFWKWEHHALSCAKKLIKMAQQNENSTWSKSRFSKLLIFFCCRLNYFCVLSISFFALQPLYKSLSFYTINN